MNKRVYIFCFILLITIGNGFAQQLRVAKLRNGLSVYVWEDLSKPDVTGVIATRAGSVNDPADLTGMAHYLEHLLFKGTETISSLDWEKEKPVYDQIIAQYDEMAKETDETKRQAIAKAINDLTIEAAKYSNGDEFSKLIQQIGGKGLNAATSYDFTYYYNTFPANHLEKWLEIYSERMIGPVFRTFQTELETVYEEYNRAQDNRGRRLNEYITANLYKGHPYSRSVVGLSEHLKNPQLSRLIEFYNTWYVPGNMALILVGNINADEAMPLIREKFAKMPKRPVTERPEFSAEPIRGRREVSAKIMPYPMVVMGYPAVPGNHPDRLPLEIACSLLSNSSHTGMLDKLVLDGELNGMSCNLDSRKDNGNVIFTAVPYYDPAQRRWSSHGSVEKQILGGIKNLQKGDFQDWVFESVKSEMIRLYNLSLESNSGKMYQLLDAFVYEKEPGEVMDYPQLVEGVTREQVIEAARKYFGSDVLVAKINTGKLPSTEKLEKPGFKPVETVNNAKSAYAEWLETIEEKDPEMKYCDFNEVQMAPVNDKSRVFYTRNPENEVYTLTLKYGVGTRQIPDLDKAVSLMSNAGIMGQMKPIEFRQEMSKLEAKLSYRVTDDNLYIILTGNESKLQDACLLMTRQVLMPALDSKQVDQLVGSVYQGRQIEKDEIDSQEEALVEYVLYGDQSDYVNRSSLNKIASYTISDYTGMFQRATSYAAEIHYVGTYPFESVKAVLGGSLPLREGEAESTSPQIRPRKVQKENTIYFVSNSDAKQSKIYFLVEGAGFTKEKDVPVRAFNSYFHQLVYDEIREKRSMAYSAGGSLEKPVLPGYPMLLNGFVGTQGDKTVEAVKVFTELLNELPEQPERMRAVKMNLKEGLLTDKPLFRYASQVYEQWKRIGYTADPALENKELIDNLSFGDIVSVYEENLKGRPYAIAIVGNPKDVDMKALEAYGKIVQLRDNKIFAENKD